MPKKYRALPKFIQAPVPFRSPAGRNPDWSITMIFMQLTTQLIHYHVPICIIICYKPKGNIIILLSPLELRPHLHEYVFIENDIFFNENAKIVLYLNIVFVSFSYCSPWRPFLKVIVFSRFRVDAR